ncbi:DUF805 domain-containing protein [Pseudomonas sp. S31]|jgi:uncharacterized membrane protein YhaH (DUF805 family)|uniref:DUF805 domain-containing protein n=1 Tax=Pseudomonas sp. S31 TaxID=1564473 RepID=UPI001F37537F|nr:DUF805 domain-containing protein [Pseudomonas sp. S31]MBK5002444.1 DUF805 domain-containing protein [Pseudomonas sp. S31]
MSMVFCRGCAKEIHESALSCPGCGATQVASGSMAAAADNTPITFGNVFMHVMRKYAEFQGRARRKEYWLFVLVSTLIVLGFTVIETILNIPQVLSTLANLAMMVPSIAVGVRRLHDSDRSGWWLLLPIVNLVFLCLDSTPGDNRFGRNPKA